MNNHGWGLREMILLSAIILFFVILASVLVSDLYSNLEKPNSDSPSNNYASSYTQIESNLKKAAEKYYKKYQSKVGNVILSKDLKEKGYLNDSKLRTKNDTCEGYVLVDSTFEAYITCQNYETEGY